MVILLSLCLIVSSAALADDLATTANSDAKPVYKDGVLISGTVDNNSKAPTMIPMSTGRKTIKVVVVDSQGNDQSKIWNDLNANWAVYGSDQLIIDYSTLNKDNITYAEIAATGADLLHISCAGSYAHEYTLSEVDAITQYVEEGHGLVVTYISLCKNNVQLAPLVGLSASLSYATNTFSGVTFTQLQPSHPVFTSVPNPWTADTTYMATPGIYRVLPVSTYDFPHFS